MRVLVSGSTGFIGSSLIANLEREGHIILPLLRPQSGSGNPGHGKEKMVRWDPVSGHFDFAAAEGSDALVHLAGASIADGRWNNSRKNLLRTSRIDSTRHLIHALSQLQRPPRVIVAASAIGYYGNRGDEILTEDSAPGNDFLATLCQQWEAETSKGAELGARVVLLRFGMILGEHGGALPRMALPFKLGVGGRLGSGKQWMSWITLKEIISIISFVLGNSEVRGPANAVAPAPTQNAEFTRLLAHALHRPALFPAPAFALRLMLGEMADALLLASQRVLPGKLEQCGYRFKQPTLAAALADIYR